MHILASRPWLVLSLAIAAFVGGALAIQSWTLSLLLNDDARTTASAWTAFLAKQTNDLDRIATGGQPSPGTLTFLTRIEDVSRTYRFKIFDAGGKLRFISDRFSNTAEDTEDLSEHNPLAKRVVDTGQPHVEAHSIRSGDGVRFYAEAYIPTFTDEGKVLAVVEAYIDQTEKRAEFANVSFVGGSAIAFLIALAFGLPALAWYRGRGENKRSTDRIQYLANNDALSGLPNRARLSEDLARILADADTPQRLAVLKIDVDHFADLNAWLGTSAGDQIIRVVAERLRAAVDDDSGDLVARIAGDEFAVVDRNANSRASAMLLADRISQSISRPLNINNRLVRLSVCIGIALAPADGDDTDRLLKSARLALSKAKSLGRGRTQFFTPDLDSEMEARRSIEQTVTNALAHGGFATHYQPICSAETGALAGFEALARLPLPDGSMIQPGVFVPAVERMGMTNQLGAWILTDACTTAASWPEHLTVSVNLSAQQFAAPGIANVVAAALSGSGLAARRLHIEITESVLLGEHEGVTAELSRLKALGVHIVMDDFGTGYSSLSYLWRFAFDKIKIDGSFMTALEGPGAPAEKIMRAITSLGHSLGMVVCVEGVETDLQATSARSIGCDELQGFHFGKPLPAADLPALILADFRRSQMPRQAPVPSADAASL